MSIHGIIEKQFRKIVNEDNGSSVFKVDFHIHTFCSNDYEFKDKNYKDVDFKEIEQYGIVNNYFTKKQIETYKKTLKLENEEIKDQIMSSLLINKFIESNLNLAVITDHNTVAAYEKLLIAKNDADKGNKDSKYLNILPGVEITVSNQKHLIAILDPKNYLDQWRKIKEDINFIGKEGDPKLATTESINNTINIIKNHGGITYLPHLDTYEKRIKELKDQTWIMIFNNPNLDLIGLNNLYHKKHIIEEIKNDNSLSFVTDSDAHQLDKIGTGYAKIKMQFPCYENLKMSIKESSLRINQNFNENKLENMILGIAIKGGFIDNPRKEWELFSFNKDLNCIIGGRGAGKSTLLNYIVQLIEAEVSEKQLNFIGKSDMVLIFIKSNRRYYCLKYKFEKDIDNYDKKITFPSISKDGLEYKDIKPLLTTYLIDKADQDIKIKNINKNKVLKELELETYLQTEITNITKKQHKLNHWFESFIKNHSSFREEFSLINSRLLKQTDNLIRKSPNYFNNEVMKNHIEKLISEIYNIKKEIIDIYKEIVNKLNNILEGKIIIEINLDNEKKYIDELEKVLNEKREYDYNRKEEIKNKAINNISVFENINLNKLLDKIYNNETEDIIKLTGFELDYNYKYEDVERERTDITEKEIVNYLIELIREEIQTFLKYIFKNKKTNIKIKLNVNSHSKNNNNNFKSLSNLSYGQKSVAMLTIILEGFTKLGMDIPLIIDQPEDQLDNAYISEHLINNIRKIKGKRQVVFVTHNPNIPISGDAENVFCLKSDGINGWLLKNGSIDKKHILDFIIKTLEGGEEALRIRLNKYSELDLKMIKYK